MSLTAEQRRHLERRLREERARAHTGREIPYERLKVIPWARTCEPDDRASA